MDDAQKRRQMMMKGAPRPNFNKENNDADIRSASLLTSLEAQVRETGRQRRRRVEVSAPDSETVKKIQVDVPVGL